MEGSASRQETSVTTIHAAYFGPESALREWWQPFPSSKSATSEDFEALTCEPSESYVDPHKWMLLSNDGGLGHLAGYFSASRYKGLAG